MESITETLSFSRRLVPADGANTVALFDLAQWTQKFAPFLTDYQIFYECHLVDVRIRPTIPSLQLPVATDGSVPRSDRGERLQLAAKQLLSQKIALQFFGVDSAGAWQLEKELTLEGFPFEGEIAIDDRAIGSNFKFGVGVPNKWQAPLKAGDSILIAGAVSAKAYFKKKDDGIDGLSDRLRAIESLLGLFGPATATASGTNGLVKGAGAGEQNFLLRGDRTWQNPFILRGLRPRSNSYPTAYNANSVVSISPQDFQWIDGNGGNQNLPGSAGTLIKVDPLFQVPELTGQYETQEFNNAAGRWWKRDRNANVWSNWKELAFLEGTQDFTGNKSFAGFTRIGDVAPAIKTKLLTGTTAPTQGGTMTIAHGLVGNKIIAVKVLVRQSNDAGVSGSLRNQLGYEYDWWYDSASVNITNISGSSAFILSKPISILLTYIA